MDKKIVDFEAYLQSIRKRAEEEFTVKTKKYEYKDLVKLKVIADSEIPNNQQNKVKFTITQSSMEEFEISGKIKNLPGFSRDFHLELEVHDRLFLSDEPHLTVLETARG